MRNRVRNVLQFVVGSAIVHLLSVACAAGQSGGGGNAAAADDDVVAIDCSAATTETVNEVEYLYVVVDRGGRSDSAVAHAALVFVDPSPQSFGGLAFDRIPVTQRFTYSREKVWVACGAREDKLELHF